MSQGSERKREGVRGRIEEKRSVCVCVWEREGEGEGERKGEGEGAGEWEVLGR